MHLQCQAEGQEKHSGLAAESSVAQSLVVVFPQQHCRPGLSNSTQELMDRVRMGRLRQRDSFPKASIYMVSVIQGNSKEEHTCRHAFSIHG